MSVVLVDTHIALWALGRSGQSQRGGMIAAGRSRDRPLPEPDLGLGGGDQAPSGTAEGPRHLSAVLAAEFRILDVSAFLFEAAAALPRHHGDPFDRVLIAHALQDHLSVLTRDDAFAGYGCDSRAEDPGRHEGDVGAGARPATAEAAMISRSRGCSSVG